jgi:carbonic anhydrase
MHTLQNLFDNNRVWSVGRIAADPHFFERLYEIQRPEYLWIGCSDSRVPANEIVGLDPGELFVHRNVANLVVPGDANGLSVVEYAIEALKVRHVIVCGHYGCGGVQAALEGVPAGMNYVERWLAPLRGIAVSHESELTAIDDRAARWARLCEINVVEQVRRLAASDIVSQARARGIAVDLHGWIYDLRDGLLRDLAPT